MSESKSNLRKAWDRATAKKFSTYEKARNVALMPFGHVAGAPIRSAGEVAGDLLMGPRARHGAYKGKRMHARPGGPGKGMQELSIQEYLKRKKAGTPGKLYKARFGTKEYYYARKYGPKGLAGLVQRNPGKSAAAAALAYLMLKKPAAAEAGKAMAGGFVPPLPNSQMRPDVLAKFQQQPSYENPMARSVWS